MRDRMRQAGIVADPMSNTVGRMLASSGLIPGEARILLASVMKRERTWIAAHAEASVSAPDADTFQALAGRRRHGEPIAYLIGRKEFYGLPLAVNADVLIPRPETETLVEHALLRMVGSGPCRVLDLGTGSGAVALAIAHQRPNVEVMGVDVSAAAISLAVENARNLGVANVRFEVSNWFDKVSQRFDLIVANPPYVAEGDPHLAEGDLRFEPIRALVAGRDGMRAIDAIVAQAPRFLEPGGSLILEHGYDQADRVRMRLSNAGFKDVRSMRDLSGILRVTMGVR